MNERSAARSAPGRLAVAECRIGDRHVEALAGEPDRGQIVLRVAGVPALQAEAARRARHLGEGDGDRAELAAAIVARLDYHHLRVCRHALGGGGYILVEG